MTTKAAMRKLEEMFAHEIDRALRPIAQFPFQHIGKKLAERMVEDGLIMAAEIKDRGALGVMTVRGYELTDLGRFLYCSTRDDEGEA